MGKAYDVWTVSETMVTLFHNSHSHTPVSIKVTLSETRIGTDTMRLVYNTELIVDVNSNDDELRKAFIDLVCENARKVYGPAAMLAKTRPIFKITETSRDGMRELDMMGEVVNAEEY